MPWTYGLSIGHLVELSSFFTSAHCLNLSICHNDAALVHIQSTLHIAGVLTVKALYRQKKARVKTIFKFPQDNTITMVTGFRLFKTFDTSRAIYRQTMMSQWKALLHRVVSLYGTISQLTQTLCCNIYSCQHKFSIGGDLVA